MWLNLSFVKYKKLSWKVHVKVHRQNLKFSVRVAVTVLP